MAARFPLGPATGFGDHRPCRARRVVAAVAGPDAETPEALIGAVDRGFLVTELMGMGVNPVTGDYSRGASGFWIENGEITYPVSEMTVAGNLKDMFAGLTPANDLSLRHGIDAPTVRIDGMTVAGA